MIQLENPVISSGISKDERNKHVFCLHNYYTGIKVMPQEGYAYRTCSWGRAGQEIS